MNRTFWGLRRSARRAGPRRLPALVAVLAATALVVPNASVRDAPASLVKIERAENVDAPGHVVWTLLLGSDARPGQSIVRSRADAIQLVGFNTRSGAAVAIGIPRDSYVSIPGHGRNKINAAMVFGGPQLMASTVAGLSGIRPDYVFTTGFVGFRKMISQIGGVTVWSKYAFSDPVRPQGYKVGRNKLNGWQTMWFARARKPFPRGDFDRSANQQRTLKAILERVREKKRRPGFMEGGVAAVLTHMNTNVGPGELYRLAQAASRVRPRAFRSCVIGGATGSAGGASVVFANTGQLRSIARRVKGDATLEGRC